jgi:hypothetical protein
MDAPSAEKELEEAPLPPDPCIPSPGICMPEGLCMYCIDGWPYGDMPGYCAEPIWELLGYCVEGPEYCAELPEYSEKLPEYCEGLPGYCVELSEYCAELLGEAPGYAPEPRKPTCCWPGATAAVALLLRLRCFRLEDRYRSCSFRFCI